LLPFYSDGCLLERFVPPVQFQYNPEWFEDEDDADAADEWDLDKYRREKEQDDLAAEELRIAQLSLREGFHEGDADGSGGGPSY
jgi:hypothetical protein